MISHVFKLWFKPIKITNQVDSYDESSVIFIVIVDRGFSTEAARITKRIISTNSSSQGHESD